MQQRNNVLETSNDETTQQKGTGAAGEGSEAPAAKKAKCDYQGLATEIFSKGRRREQWFIKDLDTRVWSEVSLLHQRCMRMTDLEPQDLERVVPKEILQMAA